MLQLIKAIERFDFSFFKASIPAILRKSILNGKYFAVWYVIFRQDVKICIKGIIDFRLWRQIQGVCFFICFDFVQINAKIRQINFNFLFFVFAGSNRFAQIEMGNILLIGKHIQHPIVKGLQGIDGQGFHFRKIGGIQDIVHFITGKGDFFIVFFGKKAAMRCVRLIIGSGIGVDPGKFIFQGSEFGSYGRKLFGDFHQKLGGHLRRSALLPTLAGMDLSAKASFRIKALV